MSDDINVKPSNDWCCVPMCRSDGRKRGKYPFMQGISFFPFPGEKRNPKMRRKWLSLIMRPEDYEPKRSHRVCSLHFVDGKPTDSNPYPTLFPRNNYGKAKNQRSQTSVFKRERANSVSSNDDFDVKPKKLKQTMVRKTRK